MAITEDHRVETMHQIFDRFETAGYKPTWNSGLVLVDIRKKSVLITTVPQGLMHIKALGI